MKRLIDAKGKFVLNARDYTGHIICFENGYATVFDRFAKAICKFSILDAPTVDAVPVVHGRWKEADDGDGAVCSVCGEDFCNIYLEVERFKYCPNCGALMDLEVN